MRTWGSIALVLLIGGGGGYAVGGAEPAGSSAVPKPQSPAPTKAHKRYVPPSRTAKPSEPDSLPVLQSGKPVQVVEKEGFKLEIDLSPQIVTISAAKEVTTRSRADEIHYFDTVEVVADDATLRLGETAVATLPQGRRLYVDSVQKDWLAAHAVVGDELKSGWIHASQVKLVGSEPQLYATPDRGSFGKFVSTGVLIQKAKQFDDGLYASVELAAQNGAGQFAGKKQLLRALVDALAKNPPSQAAAVVAGATQLGGGEVAVPADLQSLVAGELAAFQGDALRSKPIGFYTWSNELAAIFRQDRLLQTELQKGAGGADLLAALKAQTEARRTYEKYLTLVAELTNPWNHVDAAQAMQLAETPGSFRFFPPSRSHEVDLVKKLYGNRPIPDGFNLMDELLARVRSGQIDLKPTPQSGWYDYQTYSLETLARPEQGAEAAKLRLNDEYKKMLEQLFKGAIALARETHIKQLEIPALASAAPRDGPPVVQRKKIYLSLESSVEPTATHYRRRAEAYRFVHGVLRDAFGDEGLAKMHRLTAAGPVEPNLADELAEMTALFEGAALTAARQLGLPDVGPPLDGSATAEPAAEKFLRWAATTGDDRDLNQDSRMMVPVFYDLIRGKTKVWVFLGWKASSISLDYDRKPTVKAVFDAEGTAIDPNAPNYPEIFFYGGGRTTLVPVVAEVYVDRIMDRNEFRLHCDAYQSSSAILGNLK